MDYSEKSNSNFQLDTCYNRMVFYTNFINKFKLSTQFACIPDNEWDSSLLNSSPIAFVSVNFLEGQVDT